MTQAAHIAFSHVGICVSDMERSMRFYTQALGFAISHSLDAGPPFDIMTELPELRVRATFMVRDGVMIELLHHERPTATGSAERRPMNQLGLTHLSFTVADMATVTELIGKYGGHVFAHTKVNSRNGEMMFCTDPDGIRIELWQKPA